MINIKKKNIIVFLAIILCSLCTILVLAFNSDNKAYAEETQKYSIAFSYKHYYQTGSTTKNDQSGSGFTISPKLKSTQFDTTTIRFYLYGDSFNASGTLPNGNLINFSTLNIEAVSDFQNYSYTINDKAGTLVATSEEGYISINDIADGTYIVTVKAGSVGWYINSTYSCYYTICTFSFIVDTEKPIIVGASTTIGEVNTNSQINVYEQDNFRNGKLYVNSPNSNEYVSIGTSYSLQNNAINGLYKFYAVDLAGNSSETYYVYYDNIAPEGIIKNVKGDPLTLEYTSTEFVYEAYDAGQIDYLQYKTPNSDVWLDYESGKIINNTSTNGKYVFRAIDKSGNISKESFIFFDSIKPIGSLLYEECEAINGKVYNTDTISFIASDELSGIKDTYVKLPNSNIYMVYQNGINYSDEGRYYFYCEDNAGNISITYTITIDKTSPRITNVNSFTVSKTGFSVLALDENKGKLYYKRPGNMEYVLAETNEYTVTDSDENGRYYFYASDEAGNTSSVIWVDLEIIYPEIEMIKSKTDSSVSFTWTEMEYVAKLDDKGYVKDAWIREEGSHTLTVKNLYGQTTSYTFVIDHYYTVKNIEKSCTENGCIRHICVMCGESYDTDIINSSGHVFIETEEKATCTQNGGIKHACSICGYEYFTDIILSLGHSYKTKVAVSATCISNGERSHVCEICGDEYCNEIHSTGHKYQITDVKTENGITQRLYTCTVCGESYTQSLGNQYEKVVSYVEYLFEQYCPYMWWVFLATTGVWSLAIGIAIILAHRNDEKEKAKKMIVNYLIGLIAIFSILVASPYLVCGLAILVT